MYNVWSKSVKACIEKINIFQYSGENWLYEKFYKKEYQKYAHLSQIYTGVVFSFCLIKKFIVTRAE